MYQRSIIILLFLFSYINASAQLARKGSLGAVIGFNTDSTHVLIKKVLPNTTADQLKLKEGDLIERINQKSFSTTQELIDYTSTWHAGNKLSVQVIREGRLTALQGIVIGKPKEQSSFANYIYGSVPFDEGHMRSILSMPKGITNPPVLFYLQGFGCGSQDFYHTNDNPTKILVDEITKKGFAVFRVEKPGIGDSQNKNPCELIGYHEEVRAFKAALKHLKTLDNIDTDNIFLFGHSLGGVTAPQLAAEIKVKGMINYGSVTKTWHEYLVDMVREQRHLLGDDPIELEDNVRRRIPLLHDYMVNKLTPNQLRAKPGYKEIMSTGIPLINGDRAVGRHYSFMQEINEVNTIKALKQAKCHMLALHGEFEIHAINHKWAELAANVVNTYHPGLGEWKIIPNTEHGFTYVESMEEYQRLRNEGLFNVEYMAAHFNQEVIEIVYDWMQEVMDKEVSTP